MSETQTQVKRAPGATVEDFVGQAWENVKTGDRLQLRSIECGDQLVFECLPSRMLSNRCVYSADSWFALVGQGHYRLLPDEAREAIMLPNADLRGK